MERVGWRFWRCWGSSFRLDPDTCIDDLVRSLNALGIEPIGSGEAPRIWTEFRTISRKGSEDTAPSGAATKTDAEYTTASPPEGPAEDGENIVEIGDRVQVQVSEDARVRVVTLSADRHDPDLGVISAQHPSGAALVGAQEDEEIEFEIDGKPRRWMVIKVEKGRAFATA
jgi:hypothetical protein